MMAVTTSRLWNLRGNPPCMTLRRDRSSQLVRLEVRTASRRPKRTPGEAVTFGLSKARNCVFVKMWRDQNKRTQFQQPAHAPRQIEDVSNAATQNPDRNRRTG